MVLIWLQFIACLAHSNTILKRSQATEYSIVLTAQNSQQSERVELPAAVKTALTDRLNAHHISGKYLSQPPDGYSSLQNAEKRAKLIPGQNRLTIDFKTEYYSQIAGRFRWVVHTTILLQEDDQVSIERLTIPVFHKFGHQQDAASIESAMPKVLDEVSNMVNDHIKGTKK